MKYKYIVWVGGVDEYFKNYNNAKKCYDFWIKKNYDDVTIEKITMEKK
jgi:hypothetical protein